jgi:Holliday junction resolvase RusA-like endonuclease
MDSITITFPMPDSKLSLNSRIHWAVRQKLARHARSTARIASLAALAGRKPPGWVKARYDLKAYFKTAAFPDPDNLTTRLKSSLDGIADSGIIADDKSLWPERPEFFKDSRNPRIEITIYPEP